MNEIPRPVVDRDYWQAGYAKHAFAAASSDDAVVRFIHEHVAMPETPSDAFEVGCFPGHFLVWLGRIGYRVNGIDWMPETKTALKDWLLREGLQVGELAVGNFLEFDSPKKFDLVASFGFVEHFEGWQSVIDQHCRLVKPGGLLVLAAPNFRGIVQKTLHRLLDRENLAAHNLDAMRPDLWCSRVVQQGFEPIFSGYFGGFDFWADGRGQPSLMTRIAIKAVRGLKAPIPNAGAWSPFAGLVARKRST